MKKINILILGAGGNVGQGIITALRISKIPCRIIGACTSVNSVGLFMCDSAIISPYANENKFIDWVLDLCNKEEVSIIFSGVEEIIYEIEKNRAYFNSRTSAIFITSDFDKLEIGRDKYRTANWLRDNGLNYPKSALFSNMAEVRELVSLCGFPLIAKPNLGKGSLGLIILDSEEDFKKIPNNEYCIQEFLGSDNEEFTVACYMDKLFVQQDCIIFKRKLKHGTTFLAEIVENKVIKDKCMEICDIFKPIGPLNIQLRLNNSKPVCFELNVRFSGTTPIRARYGYNDIEAMIREYIFDENVSSFLKPQKKGLVLRYYNEIYIDGSMYNELENNGFVNNVELYHNFEENKK
jgi:carbamoyl-phosphate synthase large subunit